MGDHTIPFHLSETKTAVTTTALHRLSRQDLHGSSGARVDLVVHHVLETLILVRRTEVYLGLLARVAMVHDLEATGLVAFLAKEGRDRLNREVRERSGVTLVADESGDLGQKALDQVADSHTRRNGMRIDDQVR